MIMVYINCYIIMADYDNPLTHEPVSETIYPFTGFGQF